MKEVIFDPAAAQHAGWWNQWKLESEAATVRVLEAWELWLQSPRDKPFRYDWDSQSDVWTDLKNYLVQNVFQNKCAYCEIEILGFYPDAEHFRPKGKVTVAVGQPVPRVQLADGQEVDHPGYFWLAFHWQNLVPSCKQCNSGNGKRTLFPVGVTHILEAVLSDQEAQLLSADAPDDPPRPSTFRQGVYFLPPRILNERESPLILQPLNPRPGCRPNDHIVYGVAGEVTAKAGSELGESTIKVLDLKRDQLRISRQRAQEAIRRRVFGDLAADCKIDLFPYLSRQEPHASAAISYLKLKQAELDAASAAADDF